MIVPWMDAGAEESSFLRLGQRDESSTTLGSPLGSVVPSWVLTLVFSYEFFGGDMDGENTVVTRVLEDFLKRLQEKNVVSDITEKLRELLIDKKEFGQAALKSAFFDEEGPQ